MDQNTTSLNKFISESGICSRREADKYILQGVVFVNGKRAHKGDVIKAGDRIRVNGIDLEPRQAEDVVFIALNKPVGIISTTEEHIKDNIINFVNHSKRIFPIGRLDKDSQGLIFLTNNGDLVNKILRAGNNHEKEYIVTVNKPTTSTFLSGMANGVPILGVMTKKCKVYQESANSFRIILVQGLNRQIRRMCEHFGYEVTKLIRTRIMHIDLKGLPMGDWRDLTQEEMDKLYRLVKDSDANVTQEKSGPASSKKPTRNFNALQSKDSKGRNTHLKSEKPNSGKSPKLTEFKKSPSSKTTSTPRKFKKSTDKQSSDQAGKFKKSTETKETTGSNRFKKSGKATSNQLDMKIATPKKISNRVKPGRGSKKIVQTDNPKSKLNRNPRRK